METPLRSKPGQPIEKLYIENTLLRVVRSTLLSRIQTRSEPHAEDRTQQGGRPTSTWSSDRSRIRATGQARAQALRRAHQEATRITGAPIQKQVSFTKREIMRAVGRGEWGGRDSEELSRPCIRFTTHSSKSFQKIEPANLPSTPSTSFRKL